MITVVKIGGNIINDEAALARFLDAFAQLEGPKILVHGGGRLATQLAAQLGIETTMIDGRRVTDEPTLNVVTMVYAGLTNKRIVAQLDARRCASIGLSGADASVITATRRPAIPIDVGFVGDIDAERVDTTFIQSLLDRQITPVFCSIMHNGAGQLLNCNADSVASAVAMALSATDSVRLIYCFEKQGVLRDVNDEQSVIAHISRDDFRSLKEQGIINSGMLPKIENAFKAIDNGVSSVVIKHADHLLDNIGTTLSNQ